MSAFCRDRSICIFFAPLSSLLQMLITDNFSSGQRQGQNGSAGDFSVHGRIAQPIGSGPRHTQIYSEYISCHLFFSLSESVENQPYTIHELAITLTLQDFPHRQCLLEFNCVRSTIPGSIGYKLDTWLSDCK
jgi:hypothetical protein